MGAQRRRFTLAAIASLVSLAMPRPLAAPPPSGKFRIVFLLPWGPGAERDTADLPMGAGAFTKGIVAALERFGYVQGRNLEHAKIYLPNWERAEDRSLPLNALIVPGPAPALALRPKLPDVPFLVWNVVDPVAVGIAKSFVQPGMNMTGLVLGVREGAIKQVEILRRLVPDLQGIAVHGADPPNRKPEPWDLEPIYPHFESAVRGANLKLLPVYDKFFETLGTQRERGFRAAIWAMSPPPSREKIVDCARTAIAGQVALMGPYDHLVDRGFLASYGELQDDWFLRFAQQLDRIFRAGSASNIPFMNPARYHFRLNLRTAAELGLTISPEVRVMANQLVA